MHIQRFHITNFRSLADVTINNIRSIVVLFGKNGTGKSNVLAALDAIFSPKVPSEQIRGTLPPLAPFWRGLAMDFHHNFHMNSTAPIHFEVGLIMHEQELMEIWPQVSALPEALRPPTVPVDRVRLQLLGRFEREVEILGAARIILDKAKIIDDIVLEFDGNGQEVWLPRFISLPLSERQDLGESLLGALTGLFSTVGTARFLGKEAFDDATSQEVIPSNIDRGFKGRLFSLKHSQHQDQQIVFRKIEETFKRLGEWGEIDFARGGLDNTDLEIMTYGESETWLPVGMRGTGAEQLLLLISEVLMRGSKIIGLEELESNLDEESQMKLFELLEDLVELSGGPVGQIIATAHSRFYGAELLDYEKRWVTIDTSGRTGIKAWSKQAKDSLFQPDTYFETRQERNKARATQRRAAQRVGRQRTTSL